MLLDGHRDLSVFERHTLFHPCQNLGHRRRREVSAVVAAGEDGDAVEATLLLRDDNGDDPFSGWVDYIVFVEHPDHIHPPIEPVNVVTG